MSELPFEPNLLEGKSIPSVHFLFSFTYRAVLFKSNQPALRKSDVSGKPPLWKSCSDTDKEFLPKVDARKKATIISDSLVCYRENISQSVMYLHAHTDTISCFLERDIALSLVHVKLIMMVRIR